MTPKIPVNLLMDFAVLNEVGDTRITAPKHEASCVLQDYIREHNIGIASFINNPVNVMLPYNARRWAAWHVCQMFRSGPNCLEFNTLISCSFIDAWLQTADKTPIRPPVLTNPILQSLHHLNLGVQHGFRDNFRYAAIHVSDNTSDIFHLTQFLYYTELYLPPCPSVFLIPPADPTYGVEA